ncbi:MAG: NAD(P)-dependent oxidoreductase [Actinomycetales bacterium]|nr:NAD(P)-dependent oxidoreductase [Actinomycetales bacterium]
MATLAYVGLGTMGIEMARRLLDQGHDLVVWNRSETSALAEMIERGARRARTVAEAMEASVVFSMLAHDAAVEEQFTAEALSSAGDQTVHANMATISVQAADRLEALHRAAGVAYVSAPVLGRSTVAAAGQLNIVAAGPSAAIEALAPYLDVLGKRTWVVGENARTANLVKIAVNYNLIHAIQALAESVTLVERGGVDGQQFVDILTDAAFTGSAYTGYGALIAGRRYSPPGFRMELGLKDLSLAEQAAAAAGANLPTAPVLRDLFERALDDPALVDLDWSAVAEITRGLADGTPGDRA